MHTEQTSTKVFRTGKNLISHKGLQTILALS